MKKIIVSMACGEKSRKYSEVSFPLIQKYAQRCNADFYAMFVPDFNNKVPTYQKVNYRELFNQYYRVLHIDSDMIVRSNTPNLFDVIPRENFGGVDEFSVEAPGNESPYVNRYNELRKLGVSSPEFYINAGLWLLNRDHKPLLENLNSQTINPGYFQEQTHMNYLLHEFKTPVTILPWNYNYMHLMELKGFKKDDAYIIHYAGGYGGLSEDQVIDMMKRDIK